MPAALRPRGTRGGGDFTLVEPPHAPRATHWGVLGGGGGCPPLRRLGEPGKATRLARGKACSVLCQCIYLKKKKKKNKK